MVATGNDHAIMANGIKIVRTPTGIGVQGTVPDRMQERDSKRRILKIEVDYGGKRIKEEYINQPWLLWRDYYSGIDMLKCVVRVKDGEITLVELGLPLGEGAPWPFMVPQGEQRHITESYVSVPPALIITDERGDVWTFGFQLAPKKLSPDGEFAFNVLRNGIDTREMASRIERRSGKVRIFTFVGWKWWNGKTFV